MCTAACVLGEGAMLGRTLDAEGTYGERIIALPRRAPIKERYGGVLCDHYAMIGAGLLFEDRALYFDAVNERGLAAAALNFPESAAYHKPRRGARNIPSYELIPWLLAVAASVEEATELLRGACITNDAVSDDMPPSPLHFIISDGTKCAVIEPVSSGVKIYENPYGVLTNEPPFDYHARHVSEFMGLCADAPDNRIAPDIPIKAYSRGMGAIGLPGDYSSSSRFVRALFVKSHAVIRKEQRISDFFNILDAVSVPSGCVISGAMPWGTAYASCMDLSDARYYFTSRSDRRIRSVALCDIDPTGDSAVIFDPYIEEEIIYLRGGCD